jgi:hypothetical protein
MNGAKSRKKMEFLRPLKPPGAKAEKIRNPTARPALTFEHF